MMFLVIILLIFSCTSYELSDYVINHDLIDAINNNPNSSWKAGVNAIFVGKTYRDIMPMLGFSLSSENLIESIQKVPKSDVDVTKFGDFPDHYDVYEEYPNCRFPIRNEGQCGSLYAFAPVESISDRICIATKGKKKVVLSVQDIVSCDAGSFGCQGGYMDRTWNYIRDVGVVSDECFPYVSGGGHVPKCPYKCQNSENFNTTKHKVSSWKSVKMEEAMHEIMDKGSIQTAFTGYQDFFNYKGGVYRHQTGGVAGAHVVKVQGWGVDSESKLPYWNCMMQWGPSWGLSGYIWVYRGHDECGIEDGFMVGYPELN